MAMKDVSNNALNTDALALATSLNTNTSDVFSANDPVVSFRRVSVSSDGTLGNSTSEKPSISGDGRFVTFTSGATNLVSEDTNLFQDIFLHDRQTGTTSLVSVNSHEQQANAASFLSSISSNGRYVAFDSEASNLVKRDTNGVSDIFIRDLKTGRTQGVSLDNRGQQGNGKSSAPSISGDGRYVAFVSEASNLVPGDTNGIADIFVKDMKTRSIRRVSVDFNGNQANAASSSPSISPDGRYVAFESDASNLVADDTNKTRDIFVHDLYTGTTKRVSVDSHGQQANGSSFSPSISANGRIAFISRANNLVSDDKNPWQEMFVHDLNTSETKRFRAINPDPPATSPISILGFQSPSISADGRYVTSEYVFVRGILGDIYRHDVDTGNFQLLTAVSRGRPLFNRSSTTAISANGQVVAFGSFDKKIPGAEIDASAPNSLERIFSAEIGSPLNSTTANQISFGDTFQLSEDTESEDTGKALFF